jgi:ligand-binding SRPBCC domain-containing protein
MARDAESPVAVAFVRRAIARSIDLLWLVPGGMLMVRAFTNLAELSVGWQLALLAVFVSWLQLALEPVLLRMYGATPGKLLTRICVVDVESGRCLTYAQACSRTLKVLGFGFGFWILPLTAICLMVSLWRVRYQHTLPWERSRTGAQVVDAPKRMGLAIMTLALTALPGLALPVASVIIAVIVLDLNANSGQDIHRALTGQWQWLHRLSGNELRLDARWRVLHDYMSVRGAQWSAVFAFGEGDDNRVLFDLRAKPPSTGMNACANHQLSMENEGYVFVDAVEIVQSGGHRCSSVGGKPTRKGVIYARIEGRRGSQGDQTMTLVYLGADKGARETVEELARQLDAERDKFDVAGGKLRSYYWRNDLTGRIARVPIEWIFTERRVNANGSIIFSFMRRPPGPPGTSKETVAVIALPIDHFNTDLDPHSEVEKVYANATNANKVTRRIIGPDETISRIHSDEGVTHVWSRKDLLRIWVAAWNDLSDGAQMDDLSLHPLLSQVRTTLR